jgi:hypothetical protein
VAKPSGKTSSTSRKETFRASSSDCAQGDGGRLLSIGPDREPLAAAGLSDQRLAVPGGGRLIAGGSVGATALRATLMSRFDGSRKQCPSATLAFVITRAKADCNSFQ